MVFHDGVPTGFAEMKKLWTTAAFKELFFPPYIMSIFFTVWL